MSSDAALDGKLTELLRVMMSRLPPNKKLPTAVVQQLLRTKYADTFSEAYVSSREAFIADAILKLSIEREKAAVTEKAKPAAAATAEATSSSEDEDEDEESSDDDEDSDEDSGSGEEEDEDEEASAASDEDEDESSDDEDDLDSNDNDDDDASGDEPDRKKARGEELDIIAQKEQQQQQQQAGSQVPSSSDGGSGTAVISLAERCKAMAECLRKLSYRVRAPSAEETLEAYLQNFLIAEFQKHEMDPEKYGKSDIKRYRIKREVELLQQDGASLSLDRRNRAGRGFSGVNLDSASGAAAPPTVAKKTSMFLDDE